MKHIIFCVLLTTLTACSPPSKLPPPKGAEGASSHGVLKKKAPESPAPDPWADESLLIKQPPAAPAEAFKLPPIQRHPLKNGLSVLVVRDPTLPLVNVKLLIKSGAVDDPAHKVGLSDFTMKMLRQGVRGRSADEISARVEAPGASLHISPGHESSTISCSGRSKTFDLCLQTVFELVARPTFPLNEMKEVRDSLLGQVKQARDDPGQLAALHFYNMLYGDDHPAGRPLTAKSVESITRGDLKRFHARHLLPTGSILVLSGDVPTNISKRVGARFSNWRRGRATRRVIAPVKNPRPGLRVLLVDKSDLTQSFFMLGHAGVNISNPARDPLRLVNYVLGGGGFSSRLMKEVRSKGGKTYGISSAFYAHQADGVFRVRSSTRNTEIIRTLELVRAELRKIRAKPPTKGEIKAAKGKMVGSYPIRFKTASQLAASLALAQLRGLGDRYVTEFPLRIERQGVKEIAAAARAYVKPNRLLCAIVGKASVVAPLLEAAKIPFTQISYLAPISALERTMARRAAKISPAEQRMGRKLLDRVVKANGGDRAFSKLQRLRLQGTLKRGIVPANYTLLLIAPDQARLDFELAMNKPGMPKLRLIQVLAGKKGFNLITGSPHAMSAQQVSALRSMVWRRPAFLFRHAAAREVRLRPSKETALKGKLALDVYPKDAEPLTLVFAPKTLRLIEMRRRGAGGISRITSYSDHRKVGHVWLPHHAETQSGKKVQTWIIEKIEINPKITSADITRGVADQKRN
ncbi:MAG: insulinase family protein [Deltaproteobacteria bacterium]|nr:insulinase family protein [Deltaproteobacteria bacterium]